MVDIHIYIIQIFLYLILLSTFLNYISYHKGELYSGLINKGVKISRDKHGIPHIYAENRYDALFGLGFVHAEDRLWQMYMSYLMFTGEMSQTFKTNLRAFDFFGMMFSSKDVCTKSASKLTPEEEKHIQSYSDGINFYIENTVILPIEFYIIGKFDFPKWGYYHSCMSLRLTAFLMTYGK